MSQLITPERLAWIMGVGHTTVEEWIRRRELPSFKKGRIRRFAPADVLGFIQRHTLAAKHSNSNHQHPMTEADWERIERLIFVAIYGPRRGVELSTITDA